ncbi:prickle planar cell polarity protein 3-like isoform X1 [Melospiza melodia melodia]|uniref:prickle planar cell polarity protein 3-like isoform X1 n=1 Tax=Melospiza melodia melodia TaxID=1914991 RepID=UPI002FD2A372
MFGRGSRKRLSSRSLTASGEPERGQPCNTCGDQCPGFALHKWRVAPLSGQPKEHKAKGQAQQGPALHAGRSPSAKLAAAP